MVREGDRELARRTASATRRDFPLFAWAQPARHRRTQALRAAVNASLERVNTALTSLPTQSKGIASSLTAMKTDLMAVEAAPIRLERGVSPTADAMRRLRRNPVEHVQP